MSDTGKARRSRGQAVAEFALVLPVIALLAIAIADFGRVYAAAVSVEAAAREAADYGSWNTGTAAWQSEATRRACSAMQVVEGYVGAADGSSCTNPTVTISTNEVTSAGVPLVHVQLSFQFATLVHVPPIPANVTIVRDSRFAQP